MGDAHPLPVCVVWRARLFAGASSFSIQRHDPTIHPSNDPNTQTNQEAVLRKVGEREETPLWQNVLVPVASAEARAAKAAARRGPAAASGGGGGKVRSVRGGAICMHEPLV